MHSKMAGTFVMVAALACGAIGCGSSATHGRRGTVGGAVHVRGALGMPDAYVLMEEHCHGRFEVVSEEEGLALATRDAAAGKPTVAELEIDGERVHYVCTSRLATSAR